MPFYHMTSHNQGQVLRGAAFLICDPVYSTQTLTPLPLAFIWKPSMHKCNYGQTSPICTHRTKSDTNEHTNPSLDAQTLIRHTHTQTHKDNSLYGWTQRETPYEGCNGMLINPKPLIDGPRMGSTKLAGTFLLYFPYTLSLFYPLNMFFPLCHNHYSSLYIVFKMYFVFTPCQYFSPLISVFRTLSSLRHYTWLFFFLTCSTEWIWIINSVWGESEMQFGFLSSKQ